MRFGLTRSSPSLSHLLSLSRRRRTFAVTNPSAVSARVRSSSTRNDGIDTPRSKGGKSTITKRIVLMMRPKAASMPPPAPLEDAAPPPPPGNKPPTGNWGSGGGDGGGDYGNGGNNNDDNFSGSLFVPFASLGVAAIVASFLAKFVRSESEKKVKEEEERVRRNANLPTSAMRPPGGKNVVYVGQKQDEERRRVTENVMRREREEELKRRKAAMDAPAEKAEKSTTTTTSTTKGSVRTETTNNSSKVSSNSNSTKAPKQSAEELMAEAMRHYVDLETEKKKGREELEEQLAEKQQQQQQILPPRKPAPPPPPPQQQQQQQQQQNETFDIPAPMRGQSHESNSTNTRNPRLMRALSLAADARAAADQATEAAEAAAYAAAELQATLVDRDGPPLNRENFRREFRQRLAAQYDDDDEKHQQRYRSGRYGSSNDNGSNAYGDGPSSSIGMPNGRRSMHKQHRQRHKQQQRQNQTRSQKLLESTEMWFRNTFVPTAKVATVKTVDFARENYPHVKEATLRGVSAAKQEAVKVRSTEKFKKFESFLKEKTKDITQEFGKIAKKTEEMIEEPTVIVDELQKGAKDMARESVHLWDKHVAPIVVNPELVEDDKMKNDMKNNKKDSKKQQHEHEKKRR